MKSSLEARLLKIEARNRRVELDKAWETSWTRRVTIASLTYVVVAVYLLIIGNDRPFINSIVPATGFMLSTLLMRRIRFIWQINKK